MEKNVNSGAFTCCLVNIGAGVAALFVEGLYDMAARMRTRPEESKTSKVLAAWIEWLGLAPPPYG